MQAMLVCHDPAERAVLSLVLQRAGLAVTTASDLEIVRPFSGRLLIAQVQALVRRAGSVPLFNLPTVSQADLTLDAANRAVQITGHPPRRLTHLEFRLLYTLMSHRSQILPSEVIVERVWGYGCRGDQGLVRGLVSRLRSKIESEPRTPRYVHTIPGLGYSFEPEDGSDVTKIAHSGRT